MGKKNKEIDPGLQYLRDIGFNRIRGKHGIYNRMIEVFGREKADMLLDQREKISDGSLEFYEFKNSDPVLSQIFSEGHDSDILRKACNYIFEHKELFGKEILEVGCESGYMTGFLARTFPESTIVSIDRSEAALKMAKNKAESMGITNVRFENCSLADIEGQYDTVFCMRTIQENIDHNKAAFYGESFVHQSLIYEEITEEYTKQLLKHMKPEGTLCVFERVGHNPLMLGWLLQLNKENCGIEFDSYEEFECEEIDVINTFQAFICRIGNQGKEEDLYNLWIESADIDPSGKSSLTSWAALVYLDGNAGELIRGIRVFDKEGEQIGRFAIFKDCDNDNLLYYLFAPGGEEVQLFSGNGEALKEMENNLESVINTNIKIGHRIEEIKPDDENLEKK